MALRGNLVLSRIDCVDRVKALQDEPYTQKEAEAAVGISTDNGSCRRAHETIMNMEVEMETSEQK